MLKEFRDFVLRGNVVELAVAVVIGAAFGALVTAFVAVVHHAADRGDRGKPDFSALAFTINGSRFTYGVVLQRADLVPDHRRGDLLLRRAAAQRADGAAEARAGRRPRRAPVPGVPVGHPGGRAPLRVLHRGGPRCLTCERVRVAQADALAEQGRLRAAAGGAVAEPRDLVVMTAGFEADGVNSGDVIGPDPDLEAARAFYAEHGVKWGLRVPEEMPWEHGRLLFRRRLMGLDRAAFRPAAAVPGLDVRVAGPDDLRSRCTSTRPRSGSTCEENRLWLEPLLSAERVEFALASLDGEPAGTAYVLRSDGGGGAERLPGRRGGAAGGAAARGRRGRLLVAARARVRARRRARPPQPGHRTPRRGSTSGSASPSCPGTTSTSSSSPR